MLGEEPMRRSETCSPECQDPGVQEGMFYRQQRQKNTYIANGAFATPALYVFLPDKYSIRIRGTISYKLGVVIQCAMVGCVPCLPIASMVEGVQRIKGEEHLAI